MSVLTSVNNQGQTPVPVKLNYTGLTVHATAASRTAVTNTIAVGDVLIRDPYGHDTGVGSDVAVPYTGFLVEEVCIVTKVLEPRESGYGRTVEAVWLKDVVGDIQAKCHVNATVDATTLGLVTGETAFVSSALSVASAAALTTALTLVKAIARETADTSSTAALKKIKRFPS